MTDIEKLIQTGTSIKIEVNAADLQNFGQKIAEKSFEFMQNQYPPKEPDITYISGAKVCEILDISRVTLWQWDKKGITKPIRIGNLKRYRRSDIDAIGK